MIGYVFYGEFKDGKKDGYGVMKKFNKEVYVGEWRNNQRQGWGKVFSAEKKIIENG